MTHYTSGLILDETLKKEKNCVPKLLHTPSRGIATTGAKGAVPCLVKEFELNLGTHEQLHCAVEGS